jgi:hypothetical protein
MRKVALLLLVAPLVLAACGGTREAMSPAAVRLVRSAVARTIDARGYHFAATFRGSAVGSGVVDNVRRIVRMSGQGTTVILVDGKSYESELHGRWHAFTDGNPTGLPFLPAFVLGRSSMSRVAEVRPREYRLWTAMPRVSFEVWLADGYVRRFQIQGATMNISRFGKAHLTAPSASKVAT